SFEDPGRGAILQNGYQNGKFRIPTLYNIELTAPYMHDGRFATLEEVIEHYDRGGHPSPTINTLVRPLNLTDKEKKQLLSFLKMLTDSTLLNNPEFDTPF
ncbi:MAG: cytochrome C peroxidase, partial [Bacteroidota bacterium]